MIQYKWVAQRVIPVLVAGLALFLFSCKPAVKLKRPVVKKKPRIERLYSQAEEFYGQARYEEALVLYSRCLELEPRGVRAPDCLKRMGDIYLNTGQPKKAFEMYARVRRDFPDYKELGNVELGLISALWKMRALEEVIGEARAWIGKYPKTPARPRVELILGQAYYESLKYGNALKWLVRAEDEIRPFDAEWADQISAQIKGMINEADESALEQMIEVSRQTRYYPEIAYRLGALYYRTDQLEEAEETIADLLRSGVEEKWLVKARMLYEKIFLALTADPHKIGCLLPLSGPFAIYGREVLNGIETGLGIFDRQSSGIEVVIKDTTGNPDNAAEGVEELVREEHVIAVMGPLLSRCAEKAAERAEALGVPLITICRKEDIVDKGAMIFRNFLVPKKEIERLVHVAMDRLDITKFAIMYPDNVYGAYYMQQFWDMVEDRGGEIRAAEAYDPSLTDFAAQIKRMVGRDLPRPETFLERLRAHRLPEEEESELDPGNEEPIVDFNAVFIPDSAERVAMIAPQLVYHDVGDVWLLGTSLWTSTRIISLAGDYLQGAIYTSGFFAASGTEEVETFLERYRANYGEEPGLLAATGYDTIGFLKQVVEGMAPVTRRQMQEAMVRSAPYDGVTGQISFDSSGEVKKEPFLVTVLGQKEILFP